jgi:tetratricopeptide (TPR) repeat protein
MDAEHRHELKTNELADWLGHLPDFLHKNAKTIIGAILIITAAIIFLYGRKSVAESRLAEQAQATMEIGKLDRSKMTILQSVQAEKEPPDTMIITANALEIAAQGVKNPNVSALLLIKRGEALRSDLHYMNEEVTAGIAQDHIKKARASYQKALSVIENNNTLKAMAEFGLGLCAEEVADYAEAERIYKEIIADEAYAGTVFGAQAQDRLDNMADNKMQFVFVKAPPPVAPPSINLQDLLKPKLPQLDTTGGPATKEITITPTTGPETEETSDTAAETEEPTKDPEMN